MPYKETGNENYDPKRLWAKHKEILRLRGSGLYNVKEIAELTGVTHVTVSKIINSALGKQTLAMLESAADEQAVDLMIQIRSLAPIALAVQQEMLLDEESTPKRLKNDIANKMLDRAGYTPVTKNVNANINVGLTKDELENIKKRARTLREETMEVQET